MNPPGHSEPPDPNRPIGLESITERLPGVFNPDAVANAAEERLWLENKRLQSQVEDLEQDRKERRKYAQRIFYMVVGWLIAMILIVVATGVRWPWAHQYIGFDLAERIVLTLITTTTVSVVGIFLIVASYLFPKRDTVSRQ